MSRNLPPAVRQKIAIALKEKQGQMGMPSPIRPNAAMMPPNPMPAQVNPFAPATNLPGTASPISGIPPIPKIGRFQGIKNKLGKM